MQQFTEANELMAHVPADSETANVVTPWSSFEGFHRSVALISVGDMGAGATLDAKIEQATSNAGAGAKDVTGKSITQLTQAGGDGNQPVAINLRDAELDATGGFIWVRLSITPAVGAVEFAAFLLGSNLRYEPADTTSFEEVVA